MGLYEKLAESVKVLALRCTDCGRTLHPSKSQISSYFAAGWPKCCGYTMRMHTENDPPPVAQAPT